jgi:hypothetical protein
MFRGPITNDMKTQDGPSRSWPTSHHPPLPSPRRPLTGPTPPKLDPRMKRRTTPLGFGVVVDVVGSGVGVDVVGSGVVVDDVSSGEVLDVVGSGVVSSD